MYRPVPRALMMSPPAPCRRLDGSNCKICERKPVDARAPHEGLQFEKQVKRAQECRQLQAGDWEAGLVAFGSTARRSTTPVVKARKEGDRGRLMRTSFHHQSEAQPPNGPLTAATSPDTPSRPQVFEPRRRRQASRKARRRAPRPAITRRATSASATLRSARAFRCWRRPAAA